MAVASTPANVAWYGGLFAAMSAAEFTAMITLFFEGDGGAAIHAMVYCDDDVPRAVTAAAKHHRRAATAHTRVDKRTAPRAPTPESTRGRGRPRAARATNDATHVAVTVTELSRGRLSRCGPCWRRARLLGPPSGVECSAFVAPVGVARARP